MKDLSKHQHLTHHHYRYHYGLLHRSELYFVEIAMGALVGFSLLSFSALLFFEPTAPLQQFLRYGDMFVALTLLAEFILRLILSPHRTLFIRHNWWYLIAAIPLPLSILTLLRGLRLIGLMRMLKIGLHLSFDEKVLSRDSN